MSWIEEEWKNGLSAKVLMKINAIEADVTRLTRETRQKQLQIDTVESTLAKQKSTESELNKSNSQLQRDLLLVREEKNRLDGLVKKSESELQLKAQQMQALEAQVLKSKQRIDEESLNYQRLAKDCEAIRTTADRLNRELHEKTTEVNRVLALNSNMETRLRTVQASADEGESLRKKMEAHIHTLEQQLSAAQQQSTYGGLSAAQLQSQLDLARKAAEDIKGTLSRQKDECEHRVADLTASLEALQTKFTQAQSELQHLRKDREQIKLNLDNAQRAKDACSQQLNALAAEHDAKLRQIEASVAQERSTASAQIDKLTAALRQTEAQLQVRAKEVSTLQSQLDESKQHTSALESRLAGEASQKSSLASSQSELEASLSAHKQQVALLQTQLGRAQEGNKALEQQLTHAAQAVQAAIASAVQESHDRVSELSKQYENAVTAAEQLKARLEGDLAEKTGQMSSMAAALETANAELAAAAKDLRETRQELAATKDAYSARTCKSEELDAQIQHSHQQLQTLEQLLSEKTRQLRSLQDEHASLTVELDNAKIGLAQLSSKALSAEQELKTLRDSASKEMMANMSRIEELEMDKLNALQELEQAKQVAAHRQSSMASVQALLEEQKTKNAALLSRLDLLQIDMEDKETQLQEQLVKMSNLDLEVTRLKASLSSVSDEKSKLCSGADATLASLHRDLEAATDSIAALTHDNASLKHAAACKEERIVQLAAQSTERQAALTALSAQLESKTSALDASEAKAKLLAANLDTSTMRCASLTAQVDQLKETVAALTDAKDTTVAAAESSQQTLCRLQDDYNAVCLALKNRTEAVSQLTQSAASLTSQLEEAQSKAESQAHALHAKLDATDEMLEAVRRQLLAAQELAQARAQQLEETKQELSSRSSELASLSKTLESMAAQRSQDEVSLRNAELKAGNMETHLAKEKQQCITLQQQLETLTEQAVRFEQENAKLRRDRDDCLQEASFMKDKLRQMEAKLSSVSQQLDASQTQLATTGNRANQSLDELSGELYCAQEALKAAKLDGDNLKQRTATLEVTLSRLTEEKDTLAATLESVSKAYQELKQATEMTGKDRSEQSSLLEQRLAFKTQEVTSLRQQLEETRALQARTVAGLEILQMDLEDVHAACKAAEEKETLAREQLEAKSQQMAQMQETVASAEAQRQLLLSTLEKSQERVHALEAQLAEESARLKQQAAYAASVKKECQELSQQLESKTSAMCASLEATQATLAARDKTISELSYQLDLTAQQAAERADQISQLREQSNRAHADLDRASRQLESLQEALQAKTKQVEELVYSLESAKQVKKNMESVFSTTDTELQAAQRRLKDAEAQLEAAESKIHGLERTLEEKQTDLENGVCAVAKLRDQVESLTLQLSERELAVVRCEEKFGSDLQAYLSELSTARGDLSAARASALAKADEMAELSAALEASLCKVHSLEDELSHARLALETERKASGRAEVLLAESEESCVDLKDQIHRLSVKCSGLEVEKRKLEDELHLVSNVKASELQAEKHVSDKYATVAHETATGLLKMESLLKATEGQLSLLEQELEVSKQAADASTARLASLEEQLEDVKEQNVALVNAKHTLEAELETARVELHRKGQDSHVAMLQMSESQSIETQLLESMRAQVDELGAKLSAKEKEAAALKMQCSQLLKDGEDNETAIFELGEKLAAARKERDDAEAKLASIEPQLAAARQQVDSLQGLRDAQRVKMEEMELAAEQASESLDAALRERQDAECSLLAAQELLAACEKSLAREKETAQQLSLQVKETQQLLADKEEMLKAGTDELRAQLQAALQRAQQTEAQLSAAQSQVKQNDEQAATLLEELDATSKLCTALESELEEMRQSKASDIAIVEKKIAQLERTLATATGGHEVATRTVVALEKERAELNEAIAHLRGELGAARGEVALLKEALRAAEAEKQSRVTQLEVEVERALEKHAAAERRAGEAEALLTRFETQAELPAESQSAGEAVSPKREKRVSSQMEASESDTSKENAASLMQTGGVSNAPCRAAEPADAPADAPVASKKMRLMAEESHDREEKPVEAGAGLNVSMSVGLDASFVEEPAGLSQIKSGTATAARPSAALPSGAAAGPQPPGIKSLTRPVTRVSERTRMQRPLLASTSASGGISSSVISSTSGLSGPAGGAVRVPVSVASSRLSTVTGASRVMSVSGLTSSAPAMSVASVPMDVAKPRPSTALATCATPLGASKTNVMTPTKGSSGSNILEAKSSGAAAQKAVGAVKPAAGHSTLARALASAATGSQQQQAQQAQQAQQQAQDGDCNVQ